MSTEKREGLLYCLKIKVEKEAKRERRVTEKEESLPD